MMTESVVVNVVSGDSSNTASRPPAPPAAAAAATANNNGTTQAAAQKTDSRPAASFFSKMKLDWQHFISIPGICKLTQLVSVSTRIYQSDPST
ncbi:hypothetical protein TKK_0016789 [Trichogramma kaykai]